MANHGTGTAEEQKGPILIVEDDHDIAESMAELVRADGFDARVAENGEVALRKLREGPRPSCILLDLMMPVMSGWDVLEALEKAPRLAALPIVVFTAAGEPAAHETAIGRPVLRKPIDLDLLLDMVAKFCAAGWIVNEPPSDLLPKAP